MGAFEIAITKLKLPSTFLVPHAFVCWVIVCSTSHIIVFKQFLSRKFQRDCFFFIFYVKPIIQKFKEAFTTTQL